ncbi:Glycosyltransferase, catalytic subunit of cellulose synthase and poly-beta-1,6-N-acetylglucosamine synthase [Parapedobacter indicus]|uniref:Glycosyltransferase, catalytic subunit of cellulose synthase and poly-beta-1,6-N-acetylglucosamine synthase n=3 Tax=Parapedobacter indicus TaxID=1477437 RepID=A0A1I3QTZ6_9SPHI|nr:cellulose synthase/poly-beta-1,6-N-acetylglucosamine synthase-like glycosyltransferase [Parapedobacter indicus]SFJ37753.1 Glycosyltransferase, catalytic subunit of cellulose synthase and poly-beta-1,6-N-acetylglucosamine synthase [Parapedobacter indicus]
MMNVLFYILLLVQLCLMLQLLMPLFLFILSLFKNRRNNQDVRALSSPDYAIIVTAYQQTEQLPDVVDSILKLNYDNYLVYVVADNCDVSALNFNSNKVILLRPPETLASNIKSHFYAIRNFRRHHELLTIIDSDNLVDEEYLNELNVFFDNGYEAVQGVRKAKNLDTRYACLDEAGDIYYRLIDRKLLFEAGSSAALSGSGMAFNTDLYRQCLEKEELAGAGFDKLLQYQLLIRDTTIAFAEHAIVYDEKTSRTNQLVKQRSRWINTWFKFAYLGLKMLFSSIFPPNLNRFLFSLMLLRLPLFLLLGLSFICLVVDVLVNPWLAVGWVCVFLVFVIFFVYSLIYFKADSRIFRSLLSAPRFVFFQVLALLTSRKANRISVATEHYHGGKQAEIK